jgi:hypothetical protein
MRPSGRRGLRRSVLFFRDPAAGYELAGADSHDLAELPLKIIAAVKSRLQRRFGNVHFSLAG